MTKKIFIHCKPIDYSFGFFDHYFLVIDDQEFHFGNKLKNKRLLPINSTKNSTIIAEKEICNVCYWKIFVDFIFEEDLRLFNFYPLINCETLTTGFSLQLIFNLLFIIPIFSFIYINEFKFIYFIVILMIFVIVILWYSKYKLSKVEKFKCKHLDNND